MKLVLPVAAAGLLAAVFAWPEVEGMRPQSLGEGTAARVDMTNMEAFAWDRDQPYSIRSAGISRLGDEGRRFLMDRPEARVILPDGAWLAGNSERGVVDWMKRTMHLSGAVLLQHESGFEIRTEAAFVHLEEKTAAGDRPVEGVGNKGWFRGEGFRILDGGQRIRLLGRSAVRFGASHPKASQ